MWVTLLGWLAAATGSVLALPQLVRVLRTRATAGLSLISWQITIGVCSCWVVHGWMAGRPNVWLPNGVLGLLSIPVAALIVRHRRLSPLRTWAVVVAIAGACVAVDLLTGPVVFGFAIVIPQGLAALTQLRDMRRSADLSGVSPVFLAQNVVVQFLWFSWAVPAGEPSITVAGCLTCLLWAVNLVYRQVRCARARTMTP